MADYVIARYKEPVEQWVGIVTPADRVFLYNKGPPITDVPEAWAIPRPNVGREAETYLTHIVDTYDRLAPVTIFTQASFRDHINDPSMYRQVADGLTAEQGFHAISPQRTLINDRFGAPHVVPGMDHYGMDTHALWGTIDPGHRAAPVHVFAAGAIFGVRAETIRKRPIEFYTRCLTAIAKRPYAPWEFERIWQEIFA